VAHTCHPSYTGNTNRITVQANQGTNRKPYWKNNKGKKDWGVAQAIEHLPSKCEA
jgi:hypothetical protein